jgi:hypothetical protein
VVISALIVAGFFLGLTYGVAHLIVVAVAHVGQE